MDSITHSQSKRTANADINDNESKKSKIVILSESDIERLLPVIKQIIDEKVSESDTTIRLKELSNNSKSLSLDKDEMDFIINNPVNESILMKELDIIFWEDKPTSMVCDLLLNEDDDFSDAIAGMLLIGENSMDNEFVLEVL